MTDATTITARYACDVVICEHCHERMPSGETLHGICRDRPDCARRRAAHTSAPPRPRTVGEIARAERARRMRERRAARRFDTSVEAVRATIARWAARRGVA